MTKTLYRFYAKDRHSGASIGDERYVHISSYDDNRSVVDNAGLVGDDWLTRLLEKTDARANGTVFADRAPTAEEFGTTDDMSYHYRKAVGRPLATFTEYFEADRAWTHTPFHILKVVEFAREVGALDSLYRCLSNLACRPDQVPVFTYDSARSLFWWMLSEQEHKDALYAMRHGGNGEYLIPRKPSGRYHGGLIAHQNHKDGSWEYATHT